MSGDTSPARRRLLQRLAASAAVMPLVVCTRRTLAASAPLLSVDAPEAKAVKYVENAKDAASAARGNKCANCGLYQGPEGSSQGACQLFPGKEVRASGWCSSWAPQM